MIVHPMMAYAYGHDLLNPMELQRMAQIARDEARWAREDRERNERHAEEMKAKAEEKRARKAAKRTPT